MITVHTEHGVGVEGARARGVVDRRDLDVTHVDLGAVDVHRAVPGELLRKHVQHGGLAGTRRALDEDRGVLANSADDVGALIDAEFHVLPFMPPKGRV